ncbi:unnamed protein product [Blepharisma stoltei]|uniref:Uncharacterized protein n=1 Tax=Blepharisma stoltei TaxID=1481888 RepID=A0AAU9J2Y6_9CILI|nr:unnamed protein product [Blepharisma stoltei]
MGSSHTKETESEFKKSLHATNRLISQLNEHKVKIHETIIHHSKTPVQIPDKNRLKDEFLGKIKEIEAKIALEMDELCIISESSSDTFSIQESILAPSDVFIETREEFSMKRSIPETPSSSRLPLGSIRSIVDDPDIKAIIEEKRKILEGKSSRKSNYESQEFKETTVSEDKNRLIQL